MASGHAVVKAVLSGDTLVLMGKPVNGPPPEMMVTLSSLQAPKLSRNPEQPSEPYAWSAREFLRKLAVGKAVTFKVEYKVPSINREFGSVWLDGENLCVTVAREGFAKVKTLEQSRDGSCADLDKMLEAEQVAMQEKKGMYAEDSKEANVCLKFGGEDGPTLLEQYKGKPLPAVVDSVRDGSAMRVVLLNNMQIVNFSLSGVQCPRMQPPASVLAENPDAKGPAPFAREAKYFTEVRLLHRDVQVKLEGVDKFGNLYGSIIHPSGHNISVELLKNGLGKMSDWSSIFTSVNVRSTMRNAEKQAKHGKLRLWKNYEPPSLESDKNLSGQVVEVVSGDCLVILLHNTTTEKRIFLSSIRAPRIGNARRKEPNEPYALESKDLLRRKAIGKTVSVEVEYEKKNPALGPNALMTFGTVFVEKKSNKRTNLAVEVVSAGLADVIKHKPEEEKSGYYDDLVSAENKAKKQRKGTHSGKEAPVHRYTDLCFDPNKAKHYLPFLTRDRTLKAVVEHIYSGTRFKIFVPKENCTVNFFVAGIKCPSPQRFNPSGESVKDGEPYGEESKIYARKKLMQRDVLIEVEDMDRGGNAFGKLYIEEKSQDKNYGRMILLEGLAWVDDFSIERTSGADELISACEEAKKAKKNYWKVYVEKKRAEPEIVKKDEDEILSCVKMSEIIDGTHFYMQNIAEPTCVQIEKSMQEFTRVNGLDGRTFEVKRGSVCAGVFDDGNGPVWNRAKVEQVQSNGEVRVRFIDYGNVATLPVQKLRPLDANMIKYPPQAKECVLAFIKPAPLDTEFGPDAANALGELTWGEKLSARVHGVDEYSRKRVSLYKNNQNISEALVEKGVVRVDRKWMKKAPNHQKPIVESLLQAQQTAKKRRECMWRYGDVESDDEDAP